MKQSISAFLICLAILLVSCDPCTDCGPVSHEPSVEATFFNIDSLVNVQDSIQVIDTLKVVTDSLLLVVDSISKGGDLAKERSLLENYIDGITLIRDGKTDSAFADCLDSLGVLLNEQVSILNSGRVAISDLLVVNSGLSTSSDSAVFHYLPMILSGSEANYDLTIGKESFDLNFTYELTDVMDEDRRVVRGAMIQSISHAGFDSLFCICNGLDTVDCSLVNCDAGVTSIKGYF